MLECRHLPHHQPSQLRPSPDAALDRSRRTSRPSRFSSVKKIRRPPIEESLRQPVRARLLPTQRRVRQWQRQGSVTDLVQLFVTGVAADESEQVDADVVGFERIVGVQQEPSGGLLGEECSSSKPGGAPKLLFNKPAKKEFPTSSNCA